MSEINWALPSAVTRSTYIGRVGNTGTSSVHLHFHVMTGVNQSSGAVNLTGMTGFSPNGIYPGTPGNNVVCGMLGR